MSLVATFDVDSNGSAAANTDDNNKTTRRRLRHSIYLGGKTDAKDYDKLVNRWKITHVLNCTPRKQTNIEAGVPNYFENPKLSLLSQKRLQYHRIPVYDAPSSVQELQSEHEDAIVRFITKGLLHGNVLVHCSRGVSRSTTSVVLYLMAKRDFSYEDAISMIRRRRPQAQPIPAFERWLKERDSFYRSKRKDDGDDGDAKRTSAATSTKGPMPPPTKKRKVQTPSIGPSIGPSIRPTPPPPGSSIGPALPPSMKPESPPRATSSKTNTQSIGPELPPKAGSEHNEATPPKPSIGPALFP